MDFAPIDHLAVVIDLFAAPALLFATVPIYWKWARDMRGRKIIQGMAVLVVIAALVLDATDRLGGFGPPRSALSQVVESTTRQRDTLERKRVHLQGEADYRRIIIQGNDGTGGLRKVNRNLIEAIDGPNGLVAQLRSARKLATPHDPVPTGIKNSEFKHVFTNGPLLNNCNSIDGIKMDMIWNNTGLPLINCRPTPQR
ncbi:MAG: hypothetical protein ABI450_08240 [Rhizomicrobium sp.]